MAYPILLVIYGLYCGLKFEDVWSLHIQPLASKSRKAHRIDRLPTPGGWTPKSGQLHSFRSLNPMESSGIESVSNKTIPKAASYAIFKGSERPKLQLWSWKSPWISEGAIATEFGIPIGLQQPQIQGGDKWRARKNYKMTHLPPVWLWFTFEYHGLEQTETSGKFIISQTHWSFPSLRDMWHVHQSSILGGQGYQGGYPGGHTKMVQVSFAESDWEAFLWLESSRKLLFVDGLFIPRVWTI